MSGPAPAGGGRHPGERRTRAGLLLGLGCAAGLSAAAAGLLSTRPGDLPVSPRVAAWVNGSPIRGEQLAAALAALGTDRGTAPDDTDRARVLDRLIEEELLVQRGIELGLATHDRRVRRELVMAVMQLAVSEVTAREPTASEVAAFYEANADYFARAPRLRVERIVVRAEPVRSRDEARARAEAVARRLRSGEGLAEVGRALGDPAPELPRIPLPSRKLREYLGPTALRTALELGSGEVSDPVPTTAGLEVLVLVERRSGRAPPLGEVEVEVRAELRRRAGDEALRSYLDELRSRARVRIAAVAP